MNQTLPNNQSNIKFKAPIIFLTILGLMFSLVSPFFAMKQFILNVIDWDVLSVGGNIESLSMIVIQFFFLIYVAVLHKKFKANVIMPIFLMLTALIRLSACINVWIFESDFIVECYWDWMNIVGSLAFFIAAICAFNSLFGMYAVAAAALITIITKSYSILSNIEFIADVIFEGYFIEIIQWYAPHISIIFLCMAMLVFALANAKPNAAKIPAGHMMPPAYNPQQALAMLQRRFDAGEISEQEYMYERSRIINYFNTKQF